MGIMWRFVTGQPLDGRLRTDARFLTAGERLLSRVPVRRWSYLPGYKRAAVRMGTVAALSAVLSGLWVSPGVTMGVLASTALLGAAVGVWWGVGAWRVRQLQRAYVRPLHDVLGPLLGLPPTVTPGDYLTVPVTYRSREDTPAVIRLPRSFDGSQAHKQLVSTAALLKLGLNDDTTDVIFRLVGDPVLELRRAPQPPDSVPWSDHLEFMDGLQPGQVFVGLGPKGKPFVHDWRGGEAVHAGFSVGTGYGKSSAAMSWVAQEHHNDPMTESTFIDPKGAPLPECLLGVQGYVLENDSDDVGSMWSAIYDVEIELDLRRTARKADPTVLFPMKHLIIDELTQFAIDSRRHWDVIRVDIDGPAGKYLTPPIWLAIGRILRLGREYDIRMTVFTQRLDTQALGGAQLGLRDSLGWRGLAGYRKNQWMMMIGTLPVVKCVHKKGRWYYQDGNHEMWVQNVYATAEQLRDWAMMPQRADAEIVPVASVAIEHKWDVVGLDAAAQYLQIPVSTFRKRRQRAGGIEGEGLIGRSPAWKYDQLDQFTRKEIDSGQVN